MTVPSTTTRQADGVTTERFVTCTLGAETYAVSVHAVREVMPWVAVTRIPHGAPSVKGVINLRGEIVPVIDLRAHLNLPVVEATERTCIIVLSIPNGASKLQAGLIVDSALEVIRVATADIDSGHEALPGQSGRYIMGITQGKGGLIMLLACEPLLRDGLFPAKVEMTA